MHSGPVNGVICLAIFTVAGLCAFPSANSTSILLRRFRRNVKKRRNNKKKKKKDEKRVTSVVGGSERNRRQEEETSGSLTHRVHGASLQKCNSPADDALNCNEMIVMQDVRRKTREREKEKRTGAKKTGTREKEISSCERRSG